LLKQGKLGAITGFTYNFVIDLELMFQQMVDVVVQPAPLRQDEADLLGQLTAVIKTFERPKILARLLASMKRTTPSLHVIVIDDSRHPIPMDGVDTVILPYDSGVSAGRQEGSRRVTSRYLLVLDDDFVFYRHTNLVDALFRREDAMEN
jgi:hypothetical protein